MNMMILQSDDRKESPSKKIKTYEMDYPTKLKQIIKIRTSRDKSFEKINIYRPLSFTISNIVGDSMYSRLFRTLLETR